MKMKKINGNEELLHAFGEMLGEVLEAKLEEKLGPIRKSIVEVEERLGNRLTNIELTLENDVDYKLQLLLETAEDVPLHNKQLRDHEHRIGALERFRP